MKCLTITTPDGGKTYLRLLVRGRGQDGSTNRLVGMLEQGIRSGSGKMLGWRTLSSKCCSLGCIRFRWTKVRCWAKWVFGRIMGGVGG